MWDIIFFWWRLGLVLSGAALVVFLFWMTCRRSSSRYRPSCRHKVSAHHTHRGPAQ